MRRLSLVVVLLAGMASAAAAQALSWELPVVEARSGVSYSSSAANESFVALSWQERTGTGASSAVSIYADTAWLDAANSDTRWSGRRLVHGPIPLPGVAEGGEPRMHAIALDDRRILAAIVLPSATGSEGSEVLVKASDDGGATYRELSRFTAPSVVTSPDLSRMSDGGWMLMVTRSETAAASTEGVAQTKLSIAYSLSADGARWSDLRPLVTSAPDSVDGTLRQNIQPHHAVLGNADVVVFQSMRETNHLFLKRSTDGGRTWGDSLPITSGEGFQEAVAGKQGLQQPDDFNNQRPFLAPLGDRLGLAWERAYVGSAQTPIYQVAYCELDEAGAVVLPKEYVSQGASSSLYPQVLAVEGLVRILFARQPPQSALVLSTRTAGWQSTPVAPSLGPGDFISHAVVLKDKLYLFAEVLSSKNAWALYAIRPDTSAPAPALRPQDFTPGQPASRTSAAVAWSDPADPSRIAAYRYTWAREGEAGVSVEITAAPQRLVLDTTADGAWTLSVWSIDRAGNTSREPARLTFVRDTTPPASTTLFLQPAPLFDGFLPSNDFTISWSGPEGERIARYEVSARLPADGGSLDRQLTSLRAQNVDNGEYTVSVSAVDGAGNVGPPASITIRLNRYRPVTYVARVDSRKDAGENLVLQLVGRGFATEGTVREVYLDRDGRPPYDYTLELADRRFQVPDDRHLTGITLGADYDTADYFVGVLHPVRGVRFSREAVAFQAPGTVKIGDFSFRWAPRWAAARSSRLHVPFVALLALLAAAMIAVLLVVSSRRIIATAREGAVLKAEVLALLEGTPALLTIEETEQRLRTMRRRGVGLRVKFSLLVSALAILIVAGVAVPLSLQMISRESRILATALQSRATLLVDSAAERAVRPMGIADTATVSTIPAAIAAMPDEALWLTITGPRIRLPGDPANDPIGRNYVWATNDPSWPEPTFTPGRDLYDDAFLTSEKVADLVAGLNGEATSSLAGLQAETGRLSDEADRLARIVTAGSATTADETAYQEAKQRYTEALAKGRSEILALAKQEGRRGSDPPFEPERLADSYLFYRPIVDFVVRNQNFTFGIVRLRVSTARIRSEISDATQALVRTMFVTSIAAIGVGIVGAVILAGITIRPVRKLAAGVAKIRDTEDQTRLEEVDVGTRDEIGTLAEAVNDMTRGLVKAANDKAELLVGKSLQKRFLPLDEIGGEKGSTVSQCTDHLDIYGYYEGAKGVSGDYFDFKKLDERHYAIINCDVAGKGVPAAMIMVEVATLFLGWCRDWMREASRSAKTREGLDGLVYTINDMLEERGFRGRFAALTVALFDVATGTLTVCTAGNNVLHVYDAGRGMVLPHPLPQTPAAGVFPSDLVQLKSGFPQMRLPLDRGDALFLFTDGFEESKREFRTHAGDVVACAEPGLKENESHLGTHTRGQTSEEFGIPRITGIVNAVFGRGTYRLERCHAASREELEFDFSACRGTVEEAVLALVGVEKVFRVYRDALTAAGNTIRVESKVDAFLQRCFRGYATLFDSRVEGGERDGHVLFTHLKEDHQYDDLTLLVVRRR